jgi:hypothetical protein
LTREEGALHDAGRMLRPPIAGMIFAWQNALDMAMRRNSRNESGHV